jgi:hypothetical protein
MSTDKALETARALVATVCECGHTRVNHVGMTRGEHGYCLDEDCRCKTFRPVAFTVERAK